MTDGKPGRGSLRRRLNATFLIAAAIGAVALAGSVIALVQVRDLQGQVVDEYFNAVVGTESTFTQLVDAESGLQQYSITGKEGALEPYQRALSSGATEQVEAAVAINPDLQGSYDQALHSTAAWFTEFAIPAIDTVQQDGPGSIGTAELVQGDRLFAAARADIQHFVDELTADRVAASEQLDRWSRVLFAAVLVLVGLIVAAAIVLSVQTRRWVTDPLSELSAQSRAAVEGNLKNRVVGRGPDEIVALGRDVEYMRERLLARAAELEQSRTAIEQAHETVSEQAEDLRRSNRDLEQFAYVASHDLQEPLRKVASFTQLLAKRYSGQLDERADQYIDFAVDGAKRMQQLISDLLGFSRVGRLGGEVVDVDLGACAGEAVSNLEHAIAESGASITWADLPTVRGERALLVQLMQNVIANAIKFRHPERRPEVRITARRMAHSWQVSCSDNGIGIDQQYAERVFVIFQRLHPKDVYEGTGIGLALCKKIVEFHGGDIWIEPASAGGTTISWTLPDGAASRIEHARRISSEGEPA